MTTIIFVGFGELMDYFGGIQVAQKKVKKAFENADSSLRVELIPSKIKRVKKLEKRNSSRTHGLKRLYKVDLSARVESSGDEESLDEDASKHERRSDAINADEDITLVSVQDDAEREMFDVDALGGEEMFVPRKNDNVVEEVVDVAQLAKRLQAQKQEELSDAEKATLFQQLLEKRRKHFATKRAKEKRNNPPTKAQQRKIMCTYLKNMEGYKLKDLKLKDFDSIQEMFDKAFKRVNTFEDFRTELVKRKEKRAREELIQENKEEVAIDVIPLAIKSQRIVDWKIQKERKKSYYQISMQISMLVEMKYPLTPPTLSMVLEKKLQIDYESKVAYRLCTIRCKFHAWIESKNAVEKFFEIQHAQPEDIHELLRKLLEDLEYLENSSNAITPNLPTEDPDNSLSMGDEHLSTISETESDEIIKSIIENFVPIPSESKDNSLPVFETFSDHSEETSSGSTITHADNSLPEYDSFPFEIEPDQGELTSVIMVYILGEPHVHVPNVLPTHPTLLLVSDFIPSDDSC
nr:hypothetical protein [Tanacetum cinerariifolium]